MERLRVIKNALVWRKETEAIKLAREAIEMISALSEEKLLRFLMMGRFDKSETGQSFSIIVGDEGGMFFLINSVTQNSIADVFVIEG